MEVNSLSAASIQGWLGSICIVETIDCQLIMIFGEFAFIKSGWCWISVSCCLDILIIDPVSTKD